MKDKKIMFTIFISMTLLISGCISIQVPTNLITILMNDNYNVGEKVNASLSYAGTVYYWPHHQWSVKKLVDNTWTDFTAKTDGCDNIVNCENVNFSKIEECPGLILCERPSWYKLQETPEWAWDQKYIAEKKEFTCYLIEKINRKVVSNGTITRTCGVYRQAPPGKYKMRFEYALTINPNDEYDRNVGIEYAEKEFEIVE
jgi:hypothetical protein